MRELYLIESEFKSCILTNEQRAINVSKYLLLEDKQMELKSIIDFLKSGKFGFIVSFIAFQFKYISSS